MSQPPVITVTPNPLTHSDPACIQTNGTLEKKIEIDSTLADGSHLRESVTLVEAKVTWTVPAQAQKVVFHDASGECADVTRIVA